MQDNKQGGDASISDHQYSLNKHKEMHQVEHLSDTVGDIISTVEDDSSEMESTPKPTALLTPISLSSSDSGRFPSSRQPIGTHNAPVTDEYAEIQQILPGTSTTETPRRKKASNVSVAGPHLRRRILFTETNQMENKRVSIRGDPLKRAKKELHDSIEKLKADVRHNFNLNSSIIENIDCYYVPESKKLAQQSSDVKVLAIKPTIRTKTRTEKMAIVKPASTDLSSERTLRKRPLKENEKVANELPAKKSKSLRKAKTETPKQGTSAVSTKKSSPKKSETKTATPKTVATRSARIKAKAAESNKKTSSQRSETKRATTKKPLVKPKTKTAKKEVVKTKIARPLKRTLKKVASAKRVKATKRKVVPVKPKQAKTAKKPTKVASSKKGLAPKRNKSKVKAASFRGAVAKGATKSGRITRSTKKSPMKIKIKLKSVVMKTLTSTIKKVK